MWAGMSRRPGAIGRATQLLCRKTCTNVCPSAPHGFGSSTRTHELRMQDASNPLSAWENFYVIVGSSGAALTGLQFVVIALTTELRRRRTTSQFDAFATPTIVHFSGALVISAILSAPWRELANAAVAMSIFGGAGLLYTALVARRVSRQTEYALVLEDWLFHTALPFLAYLAILVAGITLARHVVDALFAIGGATLLLVVIGIHNAWDSVTFIAAGGPQAAESANASAEARDVQSM